MVVGVRYNVGISQRPKGPNTGRKMKSTTTCITKDSDLVCGGGVREKELIEGDLKRLSRTIIDRM